MNANTTACLIRRSPTGTDSYGNVTYGETYIAYPGIWWPAGSTEATDRQDQVTWKDTLCLPASADVTTAIDAAIPEALADGSGNLILDGDGKPQGDRFSVVGQPNVWPTNPFSGWRPDFPIELILTRETG